MFAQLSLQPTLASVPVARRLAREVLWVTDCSEVTEVVSLLVTELVTNAVEHARTDFDLRVTCEASTVLVEVVDHDPTLPELHRAVPEDEGGRGVALVETFAGEWGVTPRSDGKSVWFRVPADGGAGPDEGTPTARGTSGAPG